jgi:hypothetical protein
MCACGPVEGCPERLQRFIRTAVDFWHAKANFLEREREHALAELPDAFARAPGSLALKMRRYREFVTPYVDAELARLRGEATVRVATPERIVDDALACAELGEEDIEREGGMTTLSWKLVRMDLEQQIAGIQLRATVRVEE